MSREEAPPLLQLPMFPLNTVLYPDGSLQLQIFEVRYLDMVGRSHKSGSPFGVVSLLQGSEVRQRDSSQPHCDAFAQESFADVGTLAHIEELTAPQPGLLRIRCRGGRRFRIRSREQLRHGLWMGEVQTLADDAPSPLPPDLLPLSQALGQLLAQQGAQTDTRRLDDCGWVANRWCEGLALPLSLKQSLLQLDSPLLRLELVGDWLAQHAAP